MGNEGEEGKEEEEEKPQPEKPKEANDVEERTTTTSTSSPSTKEPAFGTSEFASQKIDEHFAHLREYLKPRLDQIPREQLDYLLAFADHYAVVGNYFPNKDWFQDAGVVAMLVQCLSVRETEPLRLALKLIMIYSRLESNHREVGNVNGIPPILNAMRAVSDLEVQHQGCRALINIGTNDKNRRIIAKENGVDVLLDCLRNGGSNASLLAAACWALRNIAVHDGNKKQIAQKGGIELIVQTMQNNPTDPQVQEQACWAFGNISLKEDTRQNMAKSGAIKTVAQAMSSFPEREKLQEAGCWTFSSLVHSSLCREEFRQLGVKDLVMAASNRFPGHENIEKYVIVVIQALLESGKDGDHSDDEDATPPGGSKEPIGKLERENSAKSVAKEITVIKKGYLTKQGGRIKTWKKRWFVLDSSKLTYYRGTDELSPLGTINMYMCDGVLEDHASKKPGFLIVTRARTYKIEAGTRQDMLSWITEIRKIQMSLSSNTRPLSIDGKTYTKDMFPATTTDAPSGLSKSFFDIPTVEKALPKEIRGHLFAMILDKLPKSSHYEAIMKAKDPDVVIATIVRNLAEDVQTNRLEDGGITAITGEKSPFYDVIKYRAVVDELLDKHCTEVLDDKELLSSERKKTFLSSQIHSAQGIRKTMEDRHIEFPCLHTYISSSFEPAISVFAIYDGHGGVLAADYVAQQLHCNIMKELVEPTPPSTATTSAPEADEVTLFADGPLKKEVVDDSDIVVSPARETGDAPPEKEVENASDDVKAAPAEAKSDEKGAGKKEDEKEAGKKEAGKEDEKGAGKKDGEEAEKKKDEKEEEEEVVEELPSAPLKDDEKEFVDAVKRAFLQTNDAFFDLIQRKNLMDGSGSTAVMACIRDNALFCFWVGDSEGALFCKNAEPAVLCLPHKAKLKSEQKRIEKLGGFVQEVGGLPRLNGILAITRSFGDSRLRRFVAPEPGFVKRELDGTEKYLVLACDGLWDVMNPKDVEEFLTDHLKKKGKEGAAAALVECALERHSTDNVSVVIVFFS